MINSIATKLATPIFALFLAFGISQFVQADITIDGYTAAVNDRFTNDPSFVLNGLDISGVGQTSNSFGGQIAGRWATAISPNVVVSSNHARPYVGQEVTFYPGNDPNATPVVRTVVSGQRVTNTSAATGSDLWVGVLDSNLPSAIAPVQFTNLALTGTAPTGTNTFGPINTSISLEGENAYMFGWSPDRGNAFTNQAVGRNEITGYYEDVIFGGTTDSLYALFNTSGPSSVTNEAFLQAGDSGGPLFVEVAGQLVLLGTNAFITDDDPDTAVVESTGSGFNYIGNEVAFLDSYIAANAVPEPNSVLVLSAMLGAFVSRRRRR